MALSVTDPRWLDFGLALPGTPSTPGQPVNLAAHLDATGNIIVTCDAVPLATRYRWRMRIVGAQSDFVLAARSVDPMGSIAGVGAGVMVEIYVQAVNGSLQGVASETIPFTMPAGLAVEKAPEVSVIAKAPLLATNGNGHHGRI